MYFIKTFQDYQPVSYTGFFMHSSAWVFSSFTDMTYPNPNYNQFLAESTAIYCIHGTADRVSSFTKIATRMLAGLPSHISTIRLVTFNQRAMGKGIEFYAEQLAEKIKNNKDKHVILLGHSRGGLVAAYFGEYLAKKYGIDVRLVITLCTPFKGSDAAIFPLTWLSQSVKQMERSSKFLADLVEKMQTSTIMYHHVSAQYDGLVTSESTWVKDNALMLKRHGHLSVMSSHKLITYLKDFIGDLSKLFSTTETNEEILANLSYKIDVQVEKIKNRFHLRDSFAKRQAFINLKIMLWERFNHIACHYPEATTIGEFIHAYLKDVSLTQGTPQLSILNEPLNYPISMFNFHKPDSETFIESLLRQYKEIPLPKNNGTLEFEKRKHPEDFNFKRRSFTV